MKIVRVKDMVHGSIGITPIESLIIDSNEFQTLRFVLQNSTVFLSYPCNVSTRFPHSLGVMHLAGELIASALRNTEPKVLHKLLKDADIFFRKKAHPIQPNVDPLEEAWQNTIGNACGFFLDPQSNLKPPPQMAEDLVTEHSIEFLLNTIWQVVRIGALVHDIGHLPMSHIFEQALEKYRGGEGQSSNKLSEEMEQRREFYCQYLEGDLKKEMDTDTGGESVSIQGEIKDREFHEQRGIYIFSQIKNGIYKDKNNDYIKLILLLVEHLIVAIPEAEEPDHPLSLFRFLHSVFASNFVDADRLDYTCRDPKVSGFTLGRTDISTITDSISITKYTPTVKNGEDANCQCEYYRLTYDVKSMHSIELFFHYRYLLYKTIIYHHNVIRMNALVREILYSLISLGYENSDAALQAIFKQFHIFTYDKDGNPELLPQTPPAHVVFDDAWLRAVFLDIYRHCEVLKDEKKTEKIVKLRGLHLYLETYLFRKRENLYSVWKDEPGFFNWCDKAIRSFKNKNPEFKSYNDSYLYEVLLEFFEKKKTKARRVFERAIERTNKALNADGEIDDAIHVMHETVNAKSLNYNKMATCFKVMDETHTDVSHISPYLDSLTQVARKTPGVYVFIVGDKIKSPDKVPILNACLGHFNHEFETLVTRLIRSRLNAIDRQVVENSGK
ncbi:MAG: hypothetical protein AB2826_19520 [Candidatus Thiodiazotropha sp.]